jgi:CRISPR-associated protein Cmr4
MKIRSYLLQALSPLHAGTGQSAGVIDLPIARMRATGIPFVPGSSIKGVLKDARRRDSRIARHTLHAVFGPDRKISGPEGDVSAGAADAGAIDHAGAFIVSDARLLALPVRSFAGTFALVSSPLLLHLARRDLVESGHTPPDLPQLPGNARAARVVTGSINRHPEHERVYLEALDLPAAEDAVVDRWADFIARVLPAAERALVQQRFAVVDDDTMSFLWETATQVDTRVRIDPGTGVVEDGALWTEESLPPETLLLGLMAAHGSLRKDTPLDPGEVLAQALPAGGEILQLGGKATVGRGRCHIRPWPAAQAGQESRP